MSLHQGAFQSTKDNNFPEVNSTRIVFSNKTNVKTKDAEFLCIYELQNKLKATGEHLSIGGTCTAEHKPELWFYFTTNVCAADIHLLNLFVCLRNVGSVEISVPTNFDLNSPVLSDIPLSTYSFHAAQPDDHHYIKTYSFRLRHLELSESMFTYRHYLPIRLGTGCDRRPDPETVKILKLEHNIGGLIRKEKPDFTLVSSSGRQYDCHRLVLLAHSTVLRQQLREPALQSLSLDMTDEVTEILLNFLYTGTVENIAKNDIVLKLLDLGHRLDLPNLRHCLLPSRPAVEDKVENKDGIQSNSGDGH